MKIHYFKGFFAIIIILQPLFLLSQIDSTESRKVAFLRDHYNQEIKNQDGFLSGKLYDKQYPQFLNGPFFGNENWMECSLYYGNESFIHKYIKYDIYNDVLVALIFTTEGSKYIELHKEYISSFLIDNKTFRYIKFPNTADKKIIPKYYEIISEGDISLYKSWQKKKNKASEKTYGSFEEFYRYIILVNDIAYEISSKEQLVNILASRSKEVSDYISNNKLEFEKIFESDLINVVNYFNKK